MAEQPPSQPPSGPPGGGPPASYGYQQPAPGYGYQQPGYYAAQRPGNGIAIAAMVCGIVGLVFCWIPVVDIISIILGALGIVFGFIGNNRARELGGSGRGMAITGIVCGIIAIALSVLFWVVIGI